jgi:peptidoglycan/xylan/chitin deacetylase (PgdA/CDA1 family)
MPRHGVRRVVLCYHSIDPLKPFASASPALFEEQVAWLKARCQPVPLSAILEARAPETDRPLVSLTFDDGYADNHEHALPVLLRHGVPATFFVTVGLVERDPSVVKRFQALRAAAPGEIRSLTWEQIRGLRRANMEIGSHTWSHPNLARCSRTEALGELRRSKEAIEDHLGEPVTSLAYPFGKPGRHVAEETVRLVEQVGYRFAAMVLFRGVRPGDDPFRIPRFFVTRDSVETLEAKVRGAWDLVGLWQAGAPQWAAKIVSPRDFEL